LYRDRYFDLNVRHFHEKLGEEHQIGLSYTISQALSLLRSVPSPQRSFLLGTAMMASANLRRTREHSMANSQRNDVAGD